MVKFYLAKPERLTRPYQKPELQPFVFQKVPILQRCLANKIGRFEHSFRCLKWFSRKLPRKLRWAFLLKLRLLKIQLLVTWLKCLIKRRNILTIIVANEQKHIFLNKVLTINVRTKLFKFYVIPILLYNSNLWTLTNNMQKNIHSLERRIIRTFILNVRWPTIFKNQELSVETKLKPWTFRKRRLKWFDKVSRIDRSTRFLFYTQRFFFNSASVLLVFLINWVSNVA